jgi:hypothetical protein
MAQSSRSGSTVFRVLNVARWLIPKFAKNEFSKHIQKAYTFSCTLYIHSASIVENAEVVQVGWGALWAVQVRTHNEGTKQCADL